jgi:hypothetical protein
VAPPRSHAGGTPGAASVWMVVAPVGLTAVVLAL